MFKLIVKFNTAVINEVSINKPETTFGRKPDNDIVIDNQAVSGHHGKIIKDGNVYFVEDLKSTNGTFLNGRPITKSKLKNKDHIRVARHQFEVVTDEVSAASDDPAPDTELKPAIPTPPPQTIPPTKVKPVPLDQHNLIDQESKLKQKLPPSATIKIVAGRVGDESEITLNDFVTYIGTSDKAAIKIKGFLAPDIAAAITRRPEGYFLQAVKPGYPKVNRVAINEQIFLESGALIEVGGTNLVFYIHDKNKKENDKENSKTT